jgi:hypothetical protein
VMDREVFVYVDLDRTAHLMGRLSLSSMAT